MANGRHPYAPGFLINQRNNALIGLPFTSQSSQIGTGANNYNPYNFAVFNPYAVQKTPWNWR